jgi:hypothetical protein
MNTVEEIKGIIIASLDEFVKWPAEALLAR